MEKITISLIVLMSAVDVFDSLEYCPRQGEMRYTSISSNYCCIDASVSFTKCINFGIKCCDNFLLRVTPDDEIKDYCLPIWWILIPISLILLVACRYCCCRNFGCHLNAEKDKPYSTRTAVASSTEPIVTSSDKTEPMPGTPGFCCLQVKLQHTIYIALFRLGISTVVFVLSNLSQSYDDNSKRARYLGWDEYFMGVALITSQRSKDPITQVGSCIVNADRRIVSTGYNGMPNGCHDDKMPWGKRSSDELNNKRFYVCHAEMNAILNKISDIRGCTLYVTLFPCNECAKLIVQSGITEVVYHADTKASQLITKASKRLLEIAGIKVRQYQQSDMDFRIGPIKCKIESPINKSNKAKT